MVSQGIPANYSKELAKESKIIFWKRFEQFLNFAKIKHIQKIKNFLDSSWKNLSALFD